MGTTLACPDTTGLVFGVIVFMLLAQLAAVGLWWLVVAIYKNYDNLYELIDELDDDIAQLESENNEISELVDALTVPEDAEPAPAPDDAYEQLKAAKKAREGKNKPG